MPSNKQSLQRSASAANQSGFTANTKTYCNSRRYYKATRTHLALFRDLFSSLAGLLNSLIRSPAGSILASVRQVPGLALHLLEFAAQVTALVQVISAAIHCVTRCV